MGHLIGMAMVIRSRLPYPGSDGQKHSVRESQAINRRRHLTLERHAHAGGHRFMYGGRCIDKGYGGTLVKMDKALRKVQGDSSLHMSGVGSRIVM